MTPPPEMGSWLARLKSGLPLEEANLMVSRGGIIKTSVRAESVATGKLIEGIALDSWPHKSSGAH